MNFSQLKTGRFAAGDNCSFDTGSRNTTVSAFDDQREVDRFVGESLVSLTLTNDLPYVDASVISDSMDSGVDYRAPTVPLVERNYREIIAGAADWRNAIMEYFSVPHDGTPVRLIAPTGVGKSTEIPLFMAASMAGVVVVALPTLHLAKTMYAYMTRLIAQRNDLDGTAVCFDDGTDNAQRKIYDAWSAVVYTTASTACARAVSKASYFDRVAGVFIDEVHARLASVMFLKYYLPTYRPEMRCIIATATDGTTRFEERDQKKKRFYSKINVPYMQWKTTEGPWSPSRIRVRTLVFLPTSDLCHEFAEWYRANGHTVFVLTARTDVKELFSINKRLVTTGRQPAVVLATPEYSYGYTVFVDAVIDSGYTIMRTMVGSDLVNTIVPEDSIEAEQRAGRVGRAFNGAVMRYTADDTDVVYEQLTKEQMLLYKAWFVYAGLVFPRDDLEQYLPKFERFDKHTARMLLTSLLHPHWLSRMMTRNGRLPLELRPYERYLFQSMCRCAVYADRRTVGMAEDMNVPVHVDWFSQYGGTMHCDSYTVKSRVPQFSAAVGVLFRPLVVDEDDYDDLLNSVSEVVTSPDSVTTVPSMVHSESGSTTDTTDTRDTFGVPLDRHGEERRYTQPTVGVAGIEVSRPLPRVGLATDSQGDTRLQSVEISQDAADTSKGESFEPRPEPATDNGDKRDLSAERDLLHVQMTLPSLSKTPVQLKHGRIGFEGAADLTSAAMETIECSSLQIGFYYVPAKSPNPDRDFIKYTKEMEAKAKLFLADPESLVKYTESERLDLHDDMINYWNYLQAEITKLSAQIAACESGAVLWRVNLPRYRRRRKDTLQKAYRVSVFYRMFSELGHRVYRFVPRPCCVDSDNPCEVDRERSGKFSWVDTSLQQKTIVPLLKCEKDAIIRLFSKNIVRVYRFDGANHSFGYRWRDYVYAPHHLFVNTPYRPEVVYEIEPTQISDLVVSDKVDISKAAIYGAYGSLMFGHVVETAGSFDMAVLRIDTRLNESADTEYDCGCYEPEMTYAYRMCVMIDMLRDGTYEVTDAFPVTVPMYGKALAYYHTNPGDSGKLIVDVKTLRPLGLVSSSYVDRTHISIMPTYMK